MSTICPKCGKEQKLIGPRCECGEPDGPCSLALATGSAESKVWQAMQLKADMFDYLCWLETVTQPDEVLGTKFLVIASDHKTCWGETYAEAVRVAMEHDKEIYDATAQAVLPNQ